MNVEAAAPIKGRGPKRVRGPAAGNVGELEHDVAPEKCGVACALSKPTEQKKIALDRARSGAPISPQCNRAPKPPNRAHRRRGTLAKSQCKPNFRRLVPTMMASI